MEKILRILLTKKLINKKSSVLAVCGSSYDNQILNNFGFSNYLITSAYKSLPGIKRYKFADAQKLPFKDCSYDIVLVNLGLHHCASPHQALCEMYRVAKKVVIAHEAQDSWIIRMMVKLNLILDYEIVKGEGEHEGIINTSTVNYVYRWTRRDVEKTINSYNPALKHKIIYYRSFVFHQNFLGSGGFWEKKKFVKFVGKNCTIRIMNLITKILNKVLNQYGNDFCFVIFKKTSLQQPWVKNKHYFKNALKQVIIRK